MIFEFLSRKLGKSLFAGDPESWEVGDWAECVLIGRWASLRTFEPGAGPRHGQIMRVTGVHICHDPAVPGGRVLALSFAGWPDSRYGACAFKKLRPQADEATAAEAEFTALVRRKPQPVAPARVIEPWQ